MLGAASVLVVHARLLVFCWRRISHIGQVEGGGGGGNGGTVVLNSECHTLTTPDVSDKKITPLQTQLQDGH